MASRRVRSALAAILTLGLWLGLAGGADARTGRHGHHHAHRAVHTWPTWDNADIPDCTFAAAANWEVAALHHTPSKAEVIQGFQEAGGEAEEGLTMVQLSAWWATHGIGDIRAQLREAKGQDLWHLRSPEQGRQRLSRLERQHRYLLASVLVNWGHAILVIGVSPRGVTIVSEGHEHVRPWNEWWEEVTGVYVVSVVGHSGK